MSSCSYSAEAAWNDGGQIHHVAIVSDEPNEMVEAPGSKKFVREVPIRPNELVSMAARCC
jgi:hypothetical protein